MARWHATPLVFVGLSLLAAAPPLAPSPGPVVMITMSGLGVSAVERRLADGTLPPDGGFATLFREGLRAASLVPLDGPESGISAASLYTGTWPERHGIVGYDFRVLGDELAAPTGFLDVEYRAETLFEAAARQGLETYRILTYPSRPERGDFPNLAVLASRDSWGRDFGVSLDRLPAPGEAAIALAADGEPVTLEVERGVPWPVRLAAAPGGFRLEAGEAGAERGWPLEPGRWSPLALSDEAPASWAWARLWMPDGESAGATLLLAHPFRATGRPPGFLADLERAVGPSTKQLPAAVLERGPAWEALWWEGERRGYRQRREIVLWALRERRADLIAVRMSLDPQGHHLYAADPRHRLEAAAREPRLALYERSIRLLDDTLAELLDGAPPGTTFVVLSDHGMMTSHSTIRIHEALAAAGFRVPPDPRPELRVLSSYGPAHLYLNLAGREPDGVVEPEGAAELLARAASALADLRDPATGETVFELVAGAEEAERRHARFPERSGDLWLVSRPGYTVDETSAEGSEWLRRETEYLGMHGFLSHHRENHGFFAVLGPGVGSGRIGPVRVVDVAPTVATLAGIAAPRDSQGEARLPRRRSTE